jgi:WD40 repeat protein
VKEQSPAPLLKHLAYRPDGTQILAVDSLGKTIFLLNAQLAQPIAAMTDTRSIETATFSADGKYVIASSGTYVRIWNAETHIAVGDLIAGDDQIRSLAITDDDRQILANNLLLPGPAAWPDLLCAKLTQNMSDKQWNDWVEPSIPYKAGCPDLPKAPDKAPG